MIDKTLLPNWDSLTKEEQDLVKETHPLYFQNKKQLKANAVDFPLDIAGNDDVSEDELNRQYHTKDEDSLSKVSLPSTESN